MGQEVPIRWTLVALEASARGSFVAAAAT